MHGENLKFNWGFRKMQGEEISTPKGHLGLLIGMSKITASQI